MADDGLITVASGAPVGATIDRLVEAVTAADGGVDEVDRKIEPKFGEIGGALV